MHKNFSALTMLGEWWYIHKERKHGEMERQSQCSCDTHNYKGNICQEKRMV